MNTFDDFVSASGHKICQVWSSLNFLPPDASYFSLLTYFHKAPYYMFQTKKALDYNAIYIFLFKVFE